MGFKGEKKIICTSFTIPIIIAQFRDYLGVANFDFNQLNPAKILELLSQSVKLDLGKNSLSNQKNAQTLMGSI